MRGIPEKPQGFSSRLLRCGAWALLAVGSLCSVVVWGADAAGVVVVVTVVIGVSMGIMIDLHRVGTALRISLVVAGALLTVATMLSVLSWSELALVAPLCGLAALLVSESAAVAVPTTSEAAPAGHLPWSSAPDVEAEQASLALLGDDELCRRWRLSFLSLAQAPDSRVRVEVVRMRQLYLDEIGRRHPAELRTWLASGARAAGNPLPYLLRSTARETADGGAEDASGDSPGEATA